MKVLHIYKNYHPVAGGIEGHVKLLCSELAKQDELDVTVLVTNTGKATLRESCEQVKIVKTGEDLTVARTPISWRLWLEIARTNADITHLHFPYPFGELGHLLLGRSKKMVITYHSDIVSQKKLLRLYEPFLWRVLKRADCVVATSQKYMESSPYLSKFKEKCIIVPLSIDIARFQQAPVDEVARIRERYDGPLLLFVGKFRYYKGLEYLIEAMQHVPAQLLLVGSGPLDDKLRSQVRENRLEDKIHFLGEVSDEELIACYHACDLFILPATHRSEAFGLVQVEAMACGKPVICTEVGTGTSWVNVHDETGLVVEPANARALAEAINRLSGDPSLRERLGQNARERAHHEFAKEAMVERIIEIYRRLMS